MPITEMELGWLAGIVDGEGCIYLKIPVQTNRHMCKVNIVNTDLGILKEVRRLFTALGIFYSEHVKPISSHSIMPCSSIECNRQEEMYYFLKVLLPYLKSDKKIERATKLISYVEERRSGVRPDGRKRNTIKRR